MRCYEYAKAGDAYAITAATRPDPTPGPGQVVVRVRAASLNYRDLIQYRNLAGRNVQGIIPLSDGAGEIAAIGAGVANVHIGDRVMPNFFTAWKSGRFSMAYHGSALGGPGCDGLLTEFIAVPADSLVPIPEHLSFEEAATLPCAGVTAWQSLVVRGGLRTGDTILVLGTGGVSIFALQIGAALGCPVFVTSSSDAKLKKARSHGAAQLINYRVCPDWEKEIQRLTDKRGVDHVVEVCGGGTLAKSIASVAAGGHVALVGVLTGFGPPTESLFPLLAKNATMSGIYVGSRDHFSDLAAFLSRHLIRPVLDRVVPFEAASDAFTALVAAEHFGKIVVAIS
jgi:NADPH:quinone reductase-like Zn-dependent oxidoreductase